MNFIALGIAVVVLILSLSALVVAAAYSVYTDAR
jgi:hypothetical protein